jgi:hypothetical protein
MVDSLGQLHHYVGPENIPGWKISLSAFIGILVLFLFLIVVQAE